MYQDRKLQKQANDSKKKLKKRFLLLVMIDSGQAIAYFCLLRNINKMSNLGTPIDKYCIYIYIYNIHIYIYIQYLSMGTPLGS